MISVSVVTGINNNRPDVITFQKCATSVASVCFSFPVALSSFLSVILAVKVERDILMELRLLWGFHEVSQPLYLHKQR